MLAEGPPPAVAGSIQGYLDEIDRQRSVRSPRLLARVGFSTGYDDNVNSATTDSLIATPIGAFELSEAGQALGSGFAESTVRLAYEHPLSRRKAIDVVLSSSLRHNFDQHDFDLDVYRVETGLAYEEGARRIRGALRGTLVELAGDRFQQSGGISLVGDLSAGRWRFGANLDAALVVYPEDGLRDVVQLLGGVEASYLQPRDLLTVGVFAGSELAVESEGDFNGRDIAGLSAGWQHAAFPGHVPFARYRLLASWHHEDHPVFAERRQDVQHSAALGWNWFVSNEIAARAELDYTETRSSLELFDYDRFRIETGLSYRF